METPTYQVAAFDQAKRGVQVQTFMSELDVSMPHSRQALVEEVRCQIARKIAEKVMEKLGPAIDKAVQEAFKADPPPPVE